MEAAGSTAYVRPDEVVELQRPFEPGRFTFSSGVPVAPLPEVALCDPVETVFTGSS